MNITIPVIGSRGDVQPFIALAQGLLCAGHSVTIATHPRMETLIESHGVSFSPVGPDINLEKEAAAIRLRARNPALGLVQAMRFGFDMLERSHEDILSQCRKAELVIVPTAVAAGKNEAELLNLPYLSVTLMPWAIPWRDPDRPFIKRLVYGAVDGMVHLITTRPLNRIRKKHGLPPVGEEGFTSARLNLIPVSPAVYPPNPLWDPRHRMVGYWFAENPTGWIPPPGLLSFLDRGDAPVLISLGAMSLGDADALESASLFLTAIQQAGLRAIIQGWEVGISQLKLPYTIYSTGSLPHRWLLPKCAGVVHHGGFGTTAAGLHAGIPALVIPHLADQFYWGDQIHKLGAGPPAIRRTDLDIMGLVAGLIALTKEEKLRTSASLLGEKIRSERGVETAVRLIEEMFA